MSVYVVTGGGGFIGSHIVEELLRRNETVGTSGSQEREPTFQEYQPLERCGCFLRARCINATTQFVSVSLRQLFSFAQFLQTVSDNHVPSAISVSFN